MTNKILIICWDFLFLENVGGNRWRKYAKELFDLGYDIHIICKKVHSNESTYSIDKNFKKYVFYTISPSILSEWNIQYNNKLKLRTSLLISKIICKGTYFDKAIAIQRSFNKLCLQILSKQNIHLVIASGAPFNLLYYTSFFKKKFSYIKFIADYRDPWILAENYGMKSLTKKRFNYEQYKNNKVFENFDYLTAPNSFLLNEIKNTYNGNSLLKSKFIELPHSYSISDSIYTSSNKNDNVIKIVYAGTIYIGLDVYLDQFTEVFSKIFNNCKKLQVDFYTEQINISNNLKELSFLKFNKPDFKNISTILTHSDFILIFCAEHNKNYLTSKFFDYLPYKKPFIYVGPNGFVSSFIESNNLGINFNNCKTWTDLSKARTLSSNFDYNKFKSSYVIKEFLNSISFES